MSSGFWIAASAPAVAGKLEAHITTSTNPWQTDGLLQVPPRWRRGVKRAICVAPARPVAVLAR
jgi:hypothetical protein